LHLDGWATWNSRYHYSAIPTKGWVNDYHKESWVKHDNLAFDLLIQGRAYVRASPDPCRCFILKLSCHSINISVGLRELGNSLHRGAVASFQLGWWDGVIFLGPVRCTFVVCRHFFCYVKFNVYCSVPSLGCYPGSAPYSYPKLICNFCTPDVQEAKKWCI
jgi:hypothetical protein